MHIKKLQLNDYRGIHQLSLHLHAQLNVFVGINGSGKSSLLDASAIMLSWLINRIKHSGASGRPITESDIRNEQSNAALTMQLDDRGEAIHWMLTKGRRGRGSPVKSEFKQLSELAKHIQQWLTESEGDCNLSLLVYYPVNRAVLDIPLRIRHKHSFDLLSAFDESLTSGANFRTFFEWFREREDLENENRSLGKNKEDRQLSAVRYALTQFMPDFRHLRVRRNPLRMEVEKCGEILTVDQLSDGEKCLMAMVGDLARRLAVANPTRSKPLHGEGIVMIDEVDLHLHPRWQRMVVPKLREVFPNIQFLLSTHSPHVLNHIKPEHIFLMSSSSDGVVITKPTESFGKNVDRILEDIMGLPTTRPDETHERLAALYEQINGGQLASASEKIQQLHEDIGEDGELVKARVLIKRKELIGK